MNRCTYCHHRGPAMKPYFGVWRCKNIESCFKRILSELQEARAVGTEMSNLCFNLSQRPGEPLAVENCVSMRALARRWDERRKPKT